MWVTVELIEALKKGYVLAEIYEVWHFEEKSDELFKSYVHTFLKQKQEASGYPPGVEDQASEQACITDYKEKQGIELDPDKIVYNPAKGQIAELLLNSLWGKLAQRCNQLTTTLVRAPERFFEFLLSSKCDVSQFHFINDDVALVQRRYGSSCVLPTRSDTCLSRGPHNVLCTTRTLQEIRFAPRTRSVLRYRSSGLPF